MLCKLFAWQVIAYVCVETFGQMRGHKLVMEVQFASTV